GAHRYQASALRKIIRGVIPLSFKKTEFPFLPRFSYEEIIYSRTNQLKIITSSNIYLSNNSAI
ncbi:MAG: hypothetical protein AAF378_21735, partial [Cyanobacteria bacterium P01_A01_bin.84]